MEAESAEGQVQRRRLRHRCSVCGLRRLVRAVRSALGWTRTSKPAAIHQRSSSELMSAPTCA